MQQVKQFSTGPYFSTALPGTDYQAINVKNTFISRSCKKSTEDLLKLSRYQLRTAAAFLNGSALVKQHMDTMGLSDGKLDRRFCKMDTEGV